MPPVIPLMPRLKSNNFYQNNRKIRLFFAKKIFFSSAGGSASRPPMAFGGASIPQIQPLPPLQICG